MRLIDADAIRYERHNKVGLGVDYGVNEKEYWEFAEKEQIDKLPTIDAEPVRHGYWIKIDNNKPIGYDCSECPAMCMRQYCYCPKCGAKMDGKER